MTVVPEAAAARRQPGVLALGLERGRLEVLQFFRSRATMIFSFAFPVMLLVLFGAIFRQEVAPGISYAQYFVTGIIAAGLLSVGFQTLAIQIPIERDRGVLKRLAGTPMPKAAYFIGKVIMVLVVGILETAILLAVAALVYGAPLPDSPLKWLTLAWVGLLGIAACTLCGIAFSSLARDGKRAPSMVTPVALILQFISGVFFVFTLLPGWMQAIASLFPLKWMTQGMRAVFLPEAAAAYEPSGSWQLGLVALVLAGWVVAGLVLCILTFRWTAQDDR
jgi:ABC-2 type transport system permease protein